MKIDSFKKELDKLNLIYNQYMLDQLETYYNFLIDYNSHTNLTAIKSKEEVYLKHFYDSLTVCRAVDLNNISKIIDSIDLIDLIFYHLLQYLILLNSLLIHFLSL